MTHDHAHAKTGATGPDLSLVALVLSQLDASRTEMEKNWRAQLLVGAAGAAVLFGLDVQIAKAMVGAEFDESAARAVSRLAIAGLSLFLFYRFGVLLSEFRDRRVAAERIAELYVDGLPRKLGVDAQRLAMTNSHFDFYVWPGPRRFVWPLLLVTSAINAALHALGFSLGWRGVELIAGGHRLALAAFALVYVVPLLALYYGHCAMLADKRGRGAPYQMLYRRSIWLAAITVALSVGFGALLMVFVPAVTPSAPAA